jgi:hypothetical protein
MQSQNEKQFKTTSRDLAAFLRAKQIPVEIVPNPRRVNRVDYIAPGRIKDTAKKITTLDKSYQFVLSSLIVTGVFLLTYFDKLQGQAATCLIAMIVGNIFRKDRK